MKKFSVVIGTNYGDEGKGLTTDWLSSLTPKQKTIVARFSGGANAGHTVELDDGTRHVFSHFGSGTLQNIPTLLTRDFVVNPILFWKEAEKLQVLNVDFDIIVDQRCRVTTPFDVILNQEKERKRSDYRHGSTGVGLNETIQRDELGIELRVRDLFGPLNILHKKIEIIQSYFTKEILKINPDFDFSIIPSAVQRFIADTVDFCNFITTCVDFKEMLEYDHVIFEGSQGLMLDENSKDFPHVTRASTGVTNLMKYFENDLFKDRVIDLYYITRSYLTRHGNGPMPTEKTDMFYHDKTNQPNEFQGTLRFGDLDLTRMRHEVINDYGKISHLPIEVNVVMTWYQDSDEDKVKEFAKGVYAKNAYVARGKTSTSVEKIVL